MMSFGGTSDFCVPNVTVISDDVLFDAETQLPAQAKPVYDASMEDSQLAQWKPHVFSTKSVFKRPTKGKLTRGIRSKNVKTMKTTEPCTTAQRLTESEEYLFDNLDLNTEQVHQWEEFQAEWSDMPWIPLAKAVGAALKALIKYLLLTSVTLSPTSVSEAREMFCYKTSSTLEMTKIMVKLWQSYIKGSPHTPSQAVNTERILSSSSPSMICPGSVTSTPITSVPIRKVGVVAPSSVTYLHIDPADEVMTSIGCQLPIGEISSDIMWEQDAKYYTLKSAAISGEDCNIVNVTEGSGLSI